MRKLCLKIQPQYDVEMPSLEIKECRTQSDGIVYDIVLNSFESTLDTTLTAEELIALKSFINYVLKARKHDPKRRGK